MYTNIVIGLLVVGLLMIAEYLLCTKLKNPLWGGVIPTALLLVSIYFLIGKKIPINARTVLSIIVINVVFFEEWAQGRKRYQKKILEGFEKMKAKDI